MTLFDRAVEAFEALKAAAPAAFDRNFIRIGRQTGAGHLLDHITVRHTAEAQLDDDAIDYLLSRE